MSSSYQSTFADQISQEINQMPDEYLPMLLKVVQAFRQTVTLRPAEESFRQGWEEAMRDETMPIADLWVGIDAQ